MGWMMKTTTPPPSSPTHFSIHTTNSHFPVAQEGQISPQSIFSAPQTNLSLVLLTFICCDQQSKLSFWVRSLSSKFVNTRQLSHLLLFIPFNTFIPFTNTFPKTIPTLHPDKILVLCDQILKLKSNVLRGLRGTIFLYIDFIYLLIERSS